ncbi:MAG: tryptophanase [Saprospiraceae bacterium]|nr:tryptophanase [Saprospiraceae bacterium]
MKTIIEPFKIKSVEPIYFTNFRERKEILKNAHYNPFLIHARDVIIDLLTDSGTSAMSSAQWAGIMLGDESYAGADSFFKFESAVKKITGLPIVIPTHQGRAAEKILFSVLGGPGKTVLSNTLFDTTRANVEFTGAEGLDLVCAEGKQPGVIADFKGNIDLEALESAIQRLGNQNIPGVVITITNNSGGGQPVSMANIEGAKAICLRHGIPLIIDACRFAENCYFIKMREPGYQEESVLAIAQKLFSFADMVTMSAKKDAFANIGGFLALREEQLAQQFRNLLIVTEGFPTYGGLAGRDLEAIAQGLEEIVNEDYLRYRIRSIEYIGDKLTSAGVPLVLPTGGHAVYLDAAAFLPHISKDQYPGQALACALYLHGGIRGVEIGSVMFGKYAKDGSLISPPLELVRLAIPRRVYTQSHMDYVTEVIADVYHHRHTIRGMKITYEAPVLRHFTAHFDML